MKYVIILNYSLISFLFFLSSGCATYDPGYNAQEGAAVGAATGSVLGAIIGYQSDETGGGAALGAGAGAIIGGLIGNAKDEREDAERLQQARIRQERLNQQNALREAEIERNIALGYNVTDEEVLIAEQRAAVAKNELLKIQKERAEAIERQRRIEAAEAETRAARAEASKLMTY